MGKARFHQSPALHYCPAFIDSLMTQLDSPESNTPTDNPQAPDDGGGLFSGAYGLAAVYWVLYLVGAIVFFVLGSRAVDSEAWVRYLTIVAAMLAYTFALIVGVRASYKGPQMWKVMSRTSSVFMIINVLVGICTLGFIY